MWLTRSAMRSRIRSSAGPTRRSRWSRASASCSAWRGGAERRQGAIVIDKLLASFREEYRRVLIVTICAAVIAAAAMVAILFVGIAIFIWISNEYGAVQACLAMAGFFVVVAGLGGLTLALTQSAAQE